MCIKRERGIQYHEDGLAMIQDRKRSNPIELLHGSEG
jgi:hypothetical protein